MKKAWLFLLFGLAAWPAFSQQISGWGLNLSPSISNRRLIAYANVTEEMIREIEALETNKPSYSANLFLYWRSEKIGFQIGAGFMDIGYRTIKTPIPASDPEFPNATSRRFTYQNYNLEIPASIKFYQELGSDDFFNFMLGASLSYNLSNNVLTTLYNGETGTTTSMADESDFRKVNYAFTTGLGWEHRFSPRFTLMLQPTFAFWLKGVLKESETIEINRNLYTFGVNVGFRFDRELDR